MSLTMRGRPPASRRGRVPRARTTTATRSLHRWYRRHDLSTSTSRRGRRAAGAFAHLFDGIDAAVGVGEGDVVAGCGDGGDRRVRVVLRESVEEGCVHGRVLTADEDVHGHVEEAELVPGGGGEHELAEALGVAGPGVAHAIRGELVGQVWWLYAIEWGERVRILGG